MPVTLCHPLDSSPLVFSLPLLTVTITCIVFLSPNRTLNIFQAYSIPQFLYRQGQGMSRGRVPPPLRIIGNAAAFFFGGLFTLSIASSLAMRSLQSFLEAKRRKVALTCAACKGKGFYGCKLCKGKTTIEWSPLYDPLFINPCLCPTCDGNKIQRCLNCLGKGYV